MAWSARSSDASMGILLIPALRIFPRTRSRKSWYFSLVTRIRQIHFRTDKSGPERLLNAAPVSRLQGFVLPPESRTLSFYAILLIPRGRGRFWRNATGYAVKPGRAIFTP